MQPVPDALFLPASRRCGPRMRERVGSICEIAEPLLAVDRSAGERAWIRQQGADWLFITKSTRDTIYFPTDHPRSGQHRYTWLNQPDGSRFGYLVEGAALDAIG
jgi:hypothetical protein